MGYEKRAVAFIDILGFKSIANDVNNFEIIKKVATLIKKEKKNADKWNKSVKNNIFLENYFSDSIIMSSSLEFGGFYNLLKQVSFFMQMLIEYGFIARGGISIGDVYHKDGMIFGPALIEAVNIEQDIAIYPRVMMTSKTFKEGLYIDDNINSLEQRTEYFESVVKYYKNEIDEEFFYVDYLGQREEFDYPKLIPAFFLRDSRYLKQISNDRPGYYKWWAKKEDVEIILKKLDVDVRFEDVETDIEKKEGLDLYCIYIGIAVNESIRNRLNWHVNQRHTSSAINSGFLSTLRQSLSSILSHNQMNEEITNQFIDKLYIEYFIDENGIRSPKAKEKIREIEKEAMKKHLYILNIQGNNHSKARKIKKILRKLRKDSKPPVVQI